MKKLFSIVCLLAASSFVFAQNSTVVKNYIATYKEIAMREMQRTGVPAAITLAQGIHETGAGQSELVRKSNNHFGIKCKSEWKGESVSHDDDARGECFRKYDNPEDSYRDHSDFLKTRSHYAFLFNLDPTNYEAWAYGLKKAGYATNPKYPQILIKLIEDYNLEDYTLIAMGKKQSDDFVLVANTEPVKNNATEAEMPQAAVSITSRYPSGTFKINDTKVMVIAKGTSYLKIADDHNLSLAKLFEFNDMKPADIAPTDHILYLQRKRKKGAQEFHIVAKNETLYDVAQTEGIRLESLLSYNFLRLGMQPKAGEKLYLQQEAPTMPSLETAFTNTGTVKRNGTN
jgi:LysM repeat protein